MATASLDLTNKTLTELQELYTKIQDTISEQERARIVTAIKNNDVEVLRNTLQTLVTPLPLDEGTNEKLIQELQIDHVVEILKEQPQPVSPQRPQGTRRVFTDALARNFTEQAREEITRNLAAQAVVKAEKNKTVTPEKIIEESVKDAVPQKYQRAIKKQLVANESFVSEIQTIQKNAPVEEVDYQGFFKKIAPNNILSPIADRVFESPIFKNVQEAVVSKVLGAAWKDEVSNNTWLQQVLSGALQSQAVQQAIQSGNMMFDNTSRGAIFSKTQSFLSDVFVTVFHPQVSEVYLQLVGQGETQIRTSVGQFYLGLLTQETSSAGIRLLAKRAAAKTAGTAIGKAIGTTAGVATANPLFAALGSFLGDKVVGGVINGAKKLFNFFTLDWLGKLISGNYEGGPDPILIGSAVLVGAVCLLFVVPLTPLSLGGNSLFQDTEVNNALISGMGGGGLGTMYGSGNNAGAGFNCSWSGPTPPQTTISVCPVHAPITQRPYTQGESHRNADAYDFGCSSGSTILAAHDGYVVSVVNSYALNEYQYGSFGNNVVLVGTDASGNIFCTNYGHLADISSAAMRAFRNQTILRAGEEIGPSDTTGYTYGYAGVGHGPHLHFGYKGSGRLSLPAGCP